jgi:putative acyl-CoA dehydrogenase
LVGNLALQLQAAILLQDGDALVADAFCAARLGDVQSGWLYGTLPATIDCASLIGRASLP